MNFEQIRKKCIQQCTLKNEMSNNSTLKDCIKNLNNEGLIELYNFYDLSEEDNLYKSKQGKMNYLIREIPSQFLDDFSFMMNKEDKLTILKIYNNEKVEINERVVHFMNFGYVYITPAGKLIFPIDLMWFLLDLNLIKKS